MGVKDNEKRYKLLLEAGKALKAGDMERCRMLLLESRKYVKESKDE